MAHSAVISYLKQDSKTLGILLNKLEQLKRWNQWLQNCLPEETLLMLHCNIVNLDKSSLIVIADNPHWVTRFRFFIPDLITQMRQHPELKMIKAICCKVRPQPAGLAKIRKRLGLVIPAQHADMLNTVAKGMRNERLRAVLQRMAGRALLK